MRDVRHSEGLFASASHRGEYGKKKMPMPEGGQPRQLLYEMVSSHLEWLQRPSGAPREA